MAPVLENNSDDTGIDAHVVSQSKGHDNSEHHFVPPVANSSVVEDSEFTGICYSDDGEDEKLNDSNTTKSQDKSLSYSASPHTTSYDKSTPMNAPNTDFSVCNDHIDTASSTSSTNGENIAETMSS